MPLSIIVGMSGTSGERLALVIASARSRPDFRYGCVAVVSMNRNAIWPPIRSAAAGRGRRAG
jgi:hypothetical protein